MENVLSVEGLTKSFGDKLLFKDLNFGLQSGQKVALVARNGTGKTTLFQLLTGADAPDSGNVVYRKGLRVGFLPQEPVLNPDHTVWEAMTEHLGTPDSDEHWKNEAEWVQMLGKLGIQDTHQPVKTLSGGQRKRVALAQLFVDDPDILLLDEPTNHLDLNMIEWLEQRLSQGGKTLFMVTHDRYFLDRVCDTLLELDRGMLYTYPGNYAYYLQKKAERIDAEASNIDRAKNLYRKELEWMRRQPKARGTKSKARIDSFHGIKEVAHQKTEEKNAQLEVQMTRLGTKIVELHRIAKSFGDKKIISDFSYNFKRGERVGVIGENGSGKSTFLKLLTGELEPDRGKVVVGETVAFGHYAQGGIEVQEDQRIIDVVKDIAEVIPMAGGKKLTASQLLERFLFDKQQQYAQVQTLSGGERRRLFLLTVLMKNPNVLILDEPTNDLDIITLQILEDFLFDFPGCLIIVSHDRYFLDRLCTHLFVLRGDGTLRDFNGTLREYREVEKAERKESAKATRKAEARADAAGTDAAGTGRAASAGGAGSGVAHQPDKKKLSYNEQREYEQLEGEIERLEARKEEIAEQFTLGNLTPEEIESMSRELAEISEALDVKTDRWLTLSEYA